ncbi:NADPH-dependent FMN reductase [Blastococcus xanthinilyticus]|uniref:NAD(P)H-dependent FMN reductase n=1 Tax=Blastococcus xanthinilyticus TaxID=1564164 RepID=A0A5S5D0K2_9ACTN|nr:NAD(P)H-dependent oxidoreductase [Blastococcus xanthinilyticus]TYP88129.1 NAD(P)H-dependent FMN reductase [Blastococcus xanthinilyticus]
MTSEFTSETIDASTTAGTTRVGLVVGSTRPGRKAATVADWVLDGVRAHPRVRSGDVEFAVLDLARVALPMLDEPLAAAFGRYQHEHTRRWAATVASCDAFVFVTPEYNHSIPAAVKNAIDYLYAEWHHKAVGAVSYGLAGGVRAVEHLRTVLVEVKAVPVSAQVALSVFDDFSYANPADPTDPGVVAARPHQDAVLQDLLEELLAHSRALAPLRGSARRQADGAGDHDSGSAADPVGADGGQPVGAL